MIFDLIITDQTMPYHSGLDLAKAVFNKIPDFPVIICTGFSKKVNKQIALEAGCKGFITKPFTIKTMAEGIRFALDKGK